MCSMNDVPWISNTVVAGVMHRFFSWLGEIFGTITGVSGDTIFTVIGVPLRGFDIFMLVVCVALVFFYFYISDRIDEINAKRIEKTEAMYIRPSVAEVRNTRWNTIEQLFRSNNPADWRLGIIEADVMLDELTQMLGYPGASIGERLQSITVSQFPALNLAWEAHRVRNRIAHEGAAYQLDARQALHTFRLYEAVFKDARYI